MSCCCVPALNWKQRCRPVPCTALHACTLTPPPALPSVDFIELCEMYGLGHFTAFFLGVERTAMAARASGELHGDSGPCPKELSDAGKAAYERLTTSVKRSFNDHGFKEAARTEADGAMAKRQGRLSVRRSPLPPTPHIPHPLSHPHKQPRRSVGVFWQPLSAVMPSRINPPTSARH